MPPVRRLGKGARKTDKEAEKVCYTHAHIHRVQPRPRPGRFTCPISKRRYRSNNLADGRQMYEGEERGKERRERVSVWTGVAEQTSIGIWQADEADPFMAQKSLGKVA